MFIRSFYLSRFVFCMLIGLVFTQSVNATINTLPHYDVLPELIGKQATPNILIIYDNSFSMDQTLDDNSLHPFNGASPLSRSHIARTVMSEVFDSLVGKVNLGLMVYDANLRELVTEGHPAYDPDKLPSQQVRLRDPYGKGCSQATLDNNWGALLMDLQPFDEAARSKIGEFLATEDKVGIVPNVVESIHCTPIAGSMFNAFQYLVEENLPQDRNFTGNDSITYPSDLAGEALSCPLVTDIILVTDGVASAKNSTIGCNVYPYGSSQENTRCSLRQIEKLYQGGVRTHVIGFDGDENSNETKSLRRLTAAGDGLSLSQAMSAGYSDYPYINASNADELMVALNLVLENIYKGLAASSPASISISSTQDVASFVQSVYQPTVSGANDSLGNETSVNWVGYLRSMFYDGAGFIREDTNQNDKLDSYEIDRAIKIVSSGDGETTVERLDIQINQQGVAQEVGVIEVVPLSELKPIWDLSESLAQLDQSIISDQRVYFDNAANRYIFTSIDGSEKEFTWNADPVLGESQINPQDIEYLFINDSSDLPLTDAEEYSKASSLIAWTRGKEGLPGYRNRTLKLEKSDGDQDCFDDGADDNDCIEKRFLLGDSIHTGPITVGPPNEVYFEKYGDQSYRDFRDDDTIAQRRSVVYSGANDGMIHAINAGQYDAVLREYSSGGGFDLGAEMWAYIPESLLPHLRFWADPSYSSNSHVYGVDGHLLSFDLKVSNDEWRTYLVATTGYGGFDHQVDVNGNDLLNDDDLLLTPTVVVLDVTNPDVSPRLVAEITHPEIGAITSQPIMVKNAELDGQGEWFLVFGSGPNNIHQHERDDGASAKVFKYSLTEDSAVLEDGYPMIVPDSENGFVGDMVAADWNNNYQDDAIYFGVSKGNSANQSGQLLRLNLLDNSIQELVSTEQSFDNKPLLFSDGIDRWILIGTGRINSREDFESGETNSFYGIRESFENDSYVIDSTIIYTKDELLDVSGIDVYSDGSIQTQQELLDEDNEPIVNYEGLKSYIREDKLGWYRDLESSDNDPSERVPGAASSPGLDLLVYTSYQPEYECLIGGKSAVHTLSAMTGTAPYSKAVSPGDSVTLLETSIELDAGVLVKNVQFPGTTDTVWQQPGVEPGELGCEPGDESCDPCAPGYEGAEQCDSQCSESVEFNALCIGSDGSNPECTVSLYGSCGLGRNSWKEIDLRY